ncbi:MAG: hypothetical protein K5650_08385 [Bacteroidales bacterium]|nr:hypothetical protein [Bacteroidales bacterium]
MTATATPLPRLAKAIPLLAALVLVAGGAKAQFTVTHLDKPYNTPGSETGAVVVGDTVLVWASTQPMSADNRLFGYNPRVMQLYQARIAKTGRFSKPRLNRWQLNNDRYHTGNLAVDPASGDLYFTRCDVRDTGLNSSIYVSKRVKRHWQKPQPVGADVNIKGYTSTHPTVARLDDSTAVLYFVSNRPGGMGGMDVWYSLIVNGKASPCVNLGAPVNTPDDEVTPYYDNLNRTLYFSSNRPGGMGGHDIYCAFGSRNSWQQPAAVCHCMQSRYNDIYFTITRYEGQVPVEGYLSSNREDSFFITDSTCCNDLYHWQMDTLPPPPDTTPPPDTADLAAARTDSLRRLARERLLHSSLPLYFHNDEPDPRSNDTTTLLAYSDCYASYAALRDTYLAATVDTLEADVARFFDRTLPLNYRRLDSLAAIIADTIAAGATVCIEVDGFASPLHTSPYNRRLSARRCAALRNYLAHWNDGQLQPGMDNGRLVVKVSPQGSDSEHLAPTDNPVYSMAAIKARRIEITISISNQ